MNALRKIVPYQHLRDWRHRIDSPNLPLVATNGCFDVLHAGHVSLLERARNLGNFLVVGLSSDQAVRRLKGVGRPVVPEKDRLLVLAALEAVDAVCLFPETDATGFLEKVRPQLYVKGGDYTIETINQKERRLLAEMGTRIEILPAYEQLSTSKFLEHIRSLTVS